MPSSSVYREDHKQLLQIISNIQPLLDGGKLSDPQAVLMELTRLNGVLGSHLMMEDKFFYPRLLMHPDKRVQEVAKRFQTELGGLSTAFQSYRDAWLSGTNIAAHQKDFITATNNILSALTQRIHKEDNELYKLVDEREIDVSPSKV